MNHESNDFAGYRFTPRTARDVSYYYAGRHFKPEHHKFPWGWAVVLLAGVVLCAWLASQGV